MNARNDTLRRGGPLGLVPSLTLLFLLLQAVPASADSVHPAVPGTLIVEAALADVAAEPLDLSGAARTWTWAWGSLATDGAAVEIRDGDLRLPYGTDLSGASRGRRLAFAPNTYPVDAPLLLVGEGFVLFVTRGQLEIGTERIILRDRQRSPDGRPQMILLLGILLLTVTLMTRARRRLSSSR